MLQDSGFTDVVTGEAVDTFGGANGEGKARAFEVYGYAFMARRPPHGRPVPIGSELTVPSSSRAGHPWFSHEHVTDRKERG